MKSVTNAVRTLLYRDEVALEAARAGILNMSAYADRILPQVERETWKSVKRGTIVVALSRILSQESEREILDPKQSFKPHVRIDDISIKTPLCDISFDATRSAREATKHLLSSEVYHDAQSFFTVTEGVSEITIIAPDVHFNAVIALYAQYQEKPKAVHRSVTGISVRFSEDYIAIPNVIYTLVGQFAIRRINILEIVSTYTELAVIIPDESTEDALAALKHYMRQQ